jgi:GAF domain-containing protein
MSSRARAERPSWEEADRLAALRDYRILDTPPEPDFDDVATLAGAICEAPMALISFIDRDRQWFKSEIGLGVRETPLDTSICRHAILQEDLFVVPDTALDPRFASLPLVVGGPRIRFYAGMPVAAGEGPPLGTLCVMDTNPRPAGLTPSQATGLRTLARQVTAQIELRRLALRHTESEQRLQQALDASGVVGTWS